MPSLPSPYSGVSRDTDAPELLSLWVCLCGRHTGHCMDLQQAQRSGSMAVSHLCGSVDVRCVSLPRLERQQQPQQVEKGAVCIRAHHCCRSAACSCLRYAAGRSPEVHTCVSLHGVIQVIQCPPQIEHTHVSEVVSIHEFVLLSARLARQTLRVGCSSLRLFQAAALLLL